MSTPKPQRAAIYVRISKDKEGAGLGVGRQEHDCREFAGQLGWTIAADAGWTVMDAPKGGKPRTDGVYVDNDISAYSGSPRPGYLALLDDIKAGRVDAVMVWHTDRLHRSTVELEAYISACEAAGGIATQTVKAGLLDLTTPSGRMTARIVGSVARYEVEHMVERQQAKKKQMRGSGHWQGGPRPFGYRAEVRPDGRKQSGEDVGLIIDPEEAAEIQKAAARVLAGDTLGTIARDMNARGSRTPVEASRGGGHKWTHESLSGVLCRPLNAGLVVHRGQVVGTGRWEPILDEATWRGVKAILTAPARRTSPGPTPRHLLTGALRCGVCGNRVFRVSRQTRTRRLVYICRPGAAEYTGGCVGRDVEQLDEWIEWLVFERLSRPGAAKAFKPDVDHAELEGRRAGLRARLDELADNLDIDERTMARRSRALLAELKEAEDAIGAAFRGSALDGIALQDRAQVEATWRDLPIARRRAIVQFLMEIVVHPVKGRPRLMPEGWRKGDRYLLDTDPDAIEIVWKTP